MNRFEQDKAIDEVELLISGIGYECLEVEWDPGARVQRVYIDRVDGCKVEIVDCSRVSSQLDGWGLAQGDCRLEVSSPGLERPLRKESHFEKAIGEVVKVRSRKKIGGRKLWKGTLKSVESGLLGLEVDGETFKVPLASLQSSHIVFDWNQL